MDAGRGLGSDVQNSVPATQVSLSRVGVTGLKRILRLRDAAGRNTLFFAEMRLYARLDAKHSGVHMSRFVENIENAALEIASEPFQNFEALTDRIALEVARTQGAARAEVHIRAQYPMTKITPASKMKVENLCTFIGVSVSDGTRTRRASGVEVEGLTVCPCAREMVAEHSREMLVNAGYSERQADEIVSMLPLASHNQRGTGTLMIGSDSLVMADKLVGIVEDSMSSGMYALLKRPDELHVVREGHARPRFAEDVVREMLRGVAERIPGLADDSFVLARQENMESIHSHNAYAERCGVLGDIRAELRGGSGVTITPVSFESWLDSMSET
ncbi:MAG: GTP cyclohydrolase MptA [Synergistaceae bacterium]|jgi:GTP cyclohydrolase-4|nr:GTP cyclohydrolase MptA [Synergistaceae bacterium]